MDWDNFRFFLAVADNGSATEAARVLGVNYTTVTRRLAALEEELEVPLFDRDERQWTLTAAGEDILSSVQSISEYAGEVRRRALKETASIEGRLRITAVPILVERTLLPELKIFQDMYPGIELDLIATNDPLSLTTREADFAFRLTDNPAPHLIGHKLGIVEFGIYGAKDVAEAHQDGTPVAVIPVSFDGQTKFSWIETNFADAPRTLRCNSVEAAIAACRLGFGAARLPCAYADSDPDLFLLSGIDPDLSLDLWLLSHADLRYTPRMRVFREFVVTHMKQRLISSISA